MTRKRWSGTTDRIKLIANVVFVMGLATLLAGGTVVAVTATLPAGAHLASTGEMPAGMVVGELLGAFGLTCMLVGMVMLSRRRA